MSNSNYFNQQVERCLRLASMCSDSAVAARLRQMAVEFQDQAEQLTEKAIIAGDESEAAAGTISKTAQPH